MLKRLALCAILALSVIVLNSAAQDPPHCNPGDPNCVAVNR